MLVSPSLLMLAIQVMQQIQKDARMREAADQIRAEVGAHDGGRRAARATACASCSSISASPTRTSGRSLISVDKIEKRGDAHPRRSSSAATSRRSVIPAPMRKLQPASTGFRISRTLCAAGAPMSSQAVQHLDASARRRHVTAARPNRPRWREALAVYLQPRVLIVLFLGFSAGLPLALSGSTLLVWMREAGVDLGTIGLFALVGTPYTIKFLWAPVVDALDVPVLSRLLGRRRGWLVLSQLMLMAAIVAAGALQPEDLALVMVRSARRCWWRPPPPPRTS